jgi:hypothetical protein
MQPRETHRGGWKGGDLTAILVVDGDSRGRRLIATVLQSWIRMIGESNDKKEEKNSET